MKAVAGINDMLLLVLSIIVLLMVVYQASGSPLIAERGLTAAEQMQFDNQKADQLKALEGYYGSFMKTEGGLDSYEASFLIGAVIESVWRDCSGVCREAGDIPEFTRFFADHPIVLSKPLDCASVYEYDDGEKYQISKSRIRGMCSELDLGVDKTERVDEWTVTAWRLKDSLCKSFKVEGYQWGNAYCRNGWVFDDADATKYKCKNFCATSGINDWGKEISSDRILGWERTLELGKSYNNIKVTYDPDCTIVIGKLKNFILTAPIAAIYEFFSGSQLKQSCSMVEIGEGVAKKTVPPSVSLNIDKASFNAGDSIKFSGILKNNEGDGMPGKTIKIIKIGGEETASATTDSEGKYAVSYVVKCEIITVFAKSERGDEYAEAKSSSSNVNPSDILVCHI